MSVFIHPSAVVSPGAKIASDVKIGPFCVIGDNVKIGRQTILHSHVVIDGDTEIGEENQIFPFATLGLIPQDLKFKGEKARLIIGNKNRIREHATLHLGTLEGGMETKIGNNCLLMVGVHIAHDCKLGNGIILANNATLAGHVVVEDDVVIGGLSAIHQFVRIGHRAMIGGMSGVESDVIPYGLVKGERAALAGLNITGMKRDGVQNEEIRALKNFYDRIFEDSQGDFESRIAAAAKEFKHSKVSEVLNFLAANSHRSFCKPKKN